MGKRGCWRVGRKWEKAEEDEELHAAGKRRYWRTGRERKRLRRKKRNYKPFSHKTRKALRVYF